MTSEFTTDHGPAAATADFQARTIAVRGATDAENAAELATFLIEEMDDNGEAWGLSGTEAGRLENGLWVVPFCSYADDAEAVYQLIEAAAAHALEELGEEQFKINKDAVRAIEQDFIAGARWQKANP